MAQESFSVLILAAGKATRFKSEYSKLLHRVAGRPLGEYLLRAALSAGPEQAYMVVGPGAEKVRRTFARPGLTFCEQAEQLGTGHALMVARQELERCPSPVLVVLVGDAPLLHPETIIRLVEVHSNTRAAATVLTTLVENPTGYGRIIRASAALKDRGSSGRAVEADSHAQMRESTELQADAPVTAIIEEKVCSPEQKSIQEISSGILCFSRAKLLEHLGELTDHNAQREYLLTDMVQIFDRHGEKVAAFRVQDSVEVLGVNDRADLARIGKILRLRKAKQLMVDGVTIVDPEFTYIDDDVQIGHDSIIEPGVSIQGSTRMGNACYVQSHSSITDCVLGDRATVRQGSLVMNSQIAAGASVGPFAHVRDGSIIEQGARIGNFVEVKKSRVGQDSKALHLTYLGDSSVGAKVNIGAGTVTCNYDGERKYPTIIEEGSFIGSGTMLVAPVRVGKRSYVAAGSTITENVPPDSLAVGRAQQVNKEGWARERRMKSTQTGSQVREGSAASAPVSGGSSRGHGSIARPSPGDTLSGETLAGDASSEQTSFGLNPTEHAVGNPAAAAVSKGGTAAHHGLANQAKLMVEAISKAGPKAPPTSSDTAKPEQEKRPAAQPDPLVPGAVSVRQVGEAVVFDIKGRLTRADAASELREKIQEVVDTGRHHILINMQNVSFIDSAGIGELMAVAIQLAKVKGELKLSGLPPKVMHSIRASNLNRVLDIHPDEADALASFGQGS